MQATREKFSEAQSELWQHFCCKPCVARSERASLRKIARRRQQVENLTDIRKLASSQKNLQLLLQVVLSPNQKVLFSLLQDRGLTSSEGESEEDHGAPTVNTTVNNNSIANE